MANASLDYQDKKPMEKMGRIQRDQYSLNPIQLDVMLGVSSEAKVGIGSHRVGFTFSKGLAFSCESTALNRPHTVMPQKGSGKHYAGIGHTILKLCCDLTLGGSIVDGSS